MPEYKKIIAEITDIPVSWVRLSNMGMDLGTSLTGDNSPSDLGSMSPSRRREKMQSSGEYLPKNAGTSITNFRRGLPCKNVSGRNSSFGRDGPSIKLFNVLPELQTPVPEIHSEKSEIHSEKSDTNSESMSMAEG